MAARHTTDHGPLAGSIHLPGHELPEPVPPSRSVRLTTPLTALFPTRTCNALAAKRGIETVEDLLWFVPTRFSQVATSMSHLWPSRYLVTTGEVLTVKTKPMSGRKGSMLSATVDTPSGELAIVFFNAYGHQDRIKVGEYGLFQGPVTTFNRSWQISHPFYDMLPGEPRGPVRLDRSIVPMYREVKQMTTWTIGHCARIVLDALDMDDPLPEEILRGRDLPTFIEAMRLRHRPATREDLATARRRFAYDEALAIQVVLAERRKQAQAGIAVPRKPRRDGLLARFDERLPFELTDGQKAVGAEITADLAKDRPMLRLLQGEVGSGKTLVALRAMLAVVDAGGQSALLAPTEVLATQHHRSMSAMLGDLAEPGMLGGALDGTRVTLLTGSMSTAARKKAMLQIASGEAGIVVGTHALIQDKVSFASLGLVVVDEQHRFGVEQRDALGAKGEGEPHVLVMTATPIPRTVAMTVFGDMDVSTMRELPRGRSPIATHVITNPRWYERAWERIAEEVAAGHQAYVVCPRIDATDVEVDGVELVDDSAAAADPETEDAAFAAVFTDEDAMPAPPPELPISELSAVDDVAAELRARPDYADIRVGVLHGRLPAEEKDAVMTAFAAGEIDVLVSTTVVEVGVDVPAATVMVVMNADRFGVSQLHQLRGRIGRGTAPGLCLLVTRSASDTALERVGAVAELSDGFALADVDLRERREGDVLGARQSGGRSRLKVLRLAEDVHVIEAARADAAQLLARDPDLTAHPELRDRILASVDDEAAAFLTRG